MIVVVVIIIFFYYYCCYHYCYFYCYYQLSAWLILGRGISQNNTIQMRLDNPDIGGTETISPSRQQHVLARLTTYINIQIMRRNPSDSHWSLPIISSDHRIMHGQVMSIFTVIMRKIMVLEVDGVLQRECFQGCDYIIYADVM